MQDESKIIEYVRINTRNKKQLHQPVLLEYLNKELDVRQPDKLVARLTKKKVLKKIAVSHKCVFIVLGELALNILAESSKANVHRKIRTIK